MNDFPLRRVIKVTRGDWLLLPSGRTIEVSKVVGENHPEVHVRYLDEDAVVSTGSFTVRLEWLLVHGRRVGV